MPQVKPRQARQRRERLDWCKRLTYGGRVQGQDLEAPQCSQRLQASASELETIVQLARSSAMLGSKTVRLSIQPTASGSCVLIHTGAKDACTCNAQGQPVCLGDERILHSSKVEADRGVRITSAAVSMAFSGNRGTVTPTATVKISDSNGHTLHQVVNVMGRVRTCSPAGSMSGYPPC